MTNPNSNAGERPDISVYWVPGCSSCLRAKEFVENLGMPFESKNVAEDSEAMDEIVAAGLQGIPVVRKGNRFVYAQYIDSVVQLFGLPATRARLSKEQLLERWENVLQKARQIIANFSEATLDRSVIEGRDRSVKVLSSHVFQINEAFQKMIDEGLTDTRDISDIPRADIMSRSNLLDYIDGVLADFQTWRRSGRADHIPDRLNTFYGEHPSLPVLERFVWHSAQHARQLDHVAAGLGAELSIPPELYSDLPLPKRIWM